MGLAPPFVERELRSAYERPLPAGRVPTASGSSWSVPSSASAARAAIPCSGVDPSKLAGVDDVLLETGVEKLPAVRRVVLVGNKISPGNPVTKDDGTVVRTFWGELAWQLGGPQAYARVAADDENATSPGDALRELFNEYGPCLVLIDESAASADAKPWTGCAT